MQYMGGKTRIAKQLATIINKNITEDTIFYSLFCGACSVESLINCNKKVCNDSHEYLIELLKACQNNFVVPEIVTKEEYEYAKSNKDENKALTGFIGFACGFGGKWFGGYAKNNSGTNYAKQSKNSLEKKMKNLQKETTTFLNLSYEDVEVKDNSVVYCDPPYANTTSYYNSNKFDHNLFWKYMRTLSEKNLVFISEINAPEDFVCVWQKPLKRNLDVNKNNNFNSTEKLFIHKSNLNKIIL